MWNCGWLQHLLIPVDKHVAVYDASTWTVAFELNDSSIKEVSVSVSVRHKGWSLLIEGQVWHSDLL